MDGKDERVKIEKVDYYVIIEHKGDMKIKNDNKSIANNSSMATTKRIDQRVRKIIIHNTTINKDSYVSTTEVSENYDSIATNTSIEHKVTRFVEVEETYLDKIVNSTTHAVQLNEQSSFEFYTTESEQKTGVYRESQHFNNEIKITNKNNETIACEKGKNETDYIYIVCVVLEMVVIIMILIKMNIVKYYKLVRKERYRYFVQTLTVTARRDVQNREEIALTSL